MTPQRDDWLAPPATLHLGREEAHVWRARLDLPASRIQAFKQVLTVEERSRAGRFRFAADRSRFIASRGTLRALLSRYLGREAKAIRFAYNTYGKPILVEEPGDDPIQLNVTHSQDMALYAFTVQGDIGIDLERITGEVKDYQQIAQRFFSAAEVQALLAVPMEQRQEAFLNCWTRKEAYVKARGLGLSLVLSEFDVSLTPGVPAQLLATREKGQEASTWALHALAPGAEYIAALAASSSISTIRCWQWSA
jgi:4'-phosphopantetheinyl transferase